jgi:hypothetical protein
MLEDLPNVGWGRHMKDVDPLAELSELDFFKLGESRGEV